MRAGIEEAVGSLKATGEDALMPASYKEGMLQVMLKENVVQSTRDRV